MLDSSQGEEASFLIVEGVDRSGFRRDGGSLPLCSLQRQACCAPLTRPPASQASASFASQAGGPYATDSPRTTASCMPARTAAIVELRQLSPPSQSGRPA